MKKRNREHQQHRQEHAGQNDFHDVPEPLSRSENVPLEDDISEEEHRRLEDARRNAIVSVNGKDVNGNTDTPPAKPRDKAA